MITTTRTLSDLIIITSERRRMTNNSTYHECLFFPVQQIISTSIGAMCTAMMMVRRDLLLIYRLEFIL